MEHQSLIQEISHINPTVAIIIIWGINVISIGLHFLPMSMPDTLLWGIHIVGAALATWASVEVIITNRKKRKYGH